MMRQFQTVNDPALCDDDGTCEVGEDCINCGDCGTVPGNLCGNGLCEIGDGENFDNCPQDCAGKTKGKGAFKCGSGSGYVGCEDDRCTSGGFFCRVAPRVPACCGDALCEGQETAENCPLDCAGEAPPCEPTRCPPTALASNGPPSSSTCSSAHRSSSWPSPRLRCTSVSSPARASSIARSGWAGSARPSPWSSSAPCITARSA